MTYFELSIIIVTLGLVGITAFGILTTKKRPKARPDIEGLIVCTQKMKELSEQISQGLSSLAQSAEEDRESQRNVNKKKIT